MVYFSDFTLEQSSTQILSCNSASEVFIWKSNIQMFPPSATTADIFLKFQKMKQARNNKRKHKNPPKQAFKYYVH